MQFSREEADASLSSLYSQKLGTREGPGEGTHGMPYRPFSQRELAFF